MARNRKREKGTCHICGNEDFLSFEHVPPRSAFNNMPVMLAEYEEILKREPGSRPTGRIEQRGAGAYTLCTRCNNNTGHWYGPSFADWSRKGMEILLRAPDRTPRLVYPVITRPLFVLKQIVTMFMSVNSNKFQARNQPLVRFILNPSVKGLPPRYRLFMYFAATNDLRQLGLTASTNFDTGDSIVMSEICFPPFGYLMTFDSPPPDSRLFEITHFSRYGPNDTSLIDLRVDALHTASPLPGDFRTLPELKASYNDGQAHRTIPEKQTFSSPTQDEPGKAARLLEQIFAVSKKMNASK